MYYGCSVPPTGDPLVPYGFPCGGYITLYQRIGKSVMFREIGYFLVNGYNSITLYVPSYPALLDRYEGLYIYKNREIGDVLGNRLCSWKSVNRVLQIIRRPYYRML
jgi:hypothetical protein